MSTESKANLDGTLAILGLLVILGDWLFNIDFPEWLVWLAWAMLVINIVGIIIIMFIAFLWVKYR